MESVAKSKSGECKFVGEGMADFAGIGIMVGFIGQAVLSLGLAVWVFFVSKTGNLDIRHHHESVEGKIERKRLDFISEILMIGNDIQMTLGASYMITVFCQWNEIDLYHLHLAFDVVSFVGVSNAAALVCWSFCAEKITPSLPRRKRRHIFRFTDWFFTARHQVTYGFAAMFFTLTVLLCIRLSEWDLDAEPGRCYHARYITMSYASHPNADTVYVVISATWMLVVMFSAAFLGTMYRRWILTSAFMQFPVHLYMTIALRTENQGKLSGEESSENGWDFGQTTAVVLLGTAVEELFRKFGEYRRFERELRREEQRDRDEEQGVEDVEMEPLKPKASEAQLRLKQSQTVEETEATSTAQRASREN